MKTKDIDMEYLLMTYATFFKGDLIISYIVQERCNSIANALELRHSCTNPSIH